MSRYFGIIVLFSVFIVSIPSAYASAAHPIQIRQATDGTGGEFYDTRTGQPFLPRGVNHMPLETVIRSSPERPTGDTWSFFAVGKYSPGLAQDFLNRIAEYGYTMVRVFLAPDLIGNIPGPGLDRGYMDNIANFLALAKSKNVYLLPVIHSFPWGATYWPTLTSSEVKQMSDANAVFLNQRYIDARKQYLRDFVGELKSRNASIDAVFAYELENEFYFDMKSKPFTLNAGVIHTSAGDFDMAIPGQRVQLMAANMVNYTNQLTAAIKAEDPTALVTMGFFTPTADPANRLFDPYWLFPDPAQGGSALDFIDMHIYPFYGSAASHLSDFRISSRKKPIIAGEFGAEKGSYVNVQAAAGKLRDLQMESCQRHVRGWLLWTWNISDAQYYHGEEQNGVINRMLAPRFRPNPCSAVPAAEAVPVGWLDRIEPGGKVIGWAFDKNAASIDIHMYLDGPAGQGGRLIGLATTGTVPRPDVVAIYNDGANSGFTYQIPSQYMTDGQTHTVYAYAINKTLTGASGENPLLNNSGLVVPTGTPISPLPSRSVQQGDLNGDNRVDIFDYNILLQNFGKTGSGGWIEADIDGSGKVDIFDYNQLLPRFGK